VLRRERTPLIAVVRLRKRNEWVLPKGRLDDGETPRAAAEREVVEETGHDVSVHEFLGTLVYESGGRSKIVHYWRMETAGEQAYDLMDDVRAVDWLPSTPPSSGSPAPMSALFLPMLARSRWRRLCSPNLRGGPGQSGPPSKSAKTGRSSRPNRHSQYASQIQRGSIWYPRQNRAGSAATRRERCG